MNTHNLWFLGIFIGMSVLSWVVGRLREQAQIKRARNEARKRYEESLRTGRELEEPSKAVAVPVARNDELAERRQAQLRELRKQQESGRGAAGPVLVARQPTVQPGVIVARPTATPGRVVIQRGGAQLGRPMPAPKGQPPMRSAAPLPGATDDPRVVLARKRAADQAERERIAVLSERAETEAVRVEHARAMAPRGRATIEDHVASPQPRPLSLRSMLVGAGGAGRGADLRRAIALTEVLGKPVSMRE